MKMSFYPNSEQEGKKEGGKKKEKKKD